MRRNLNFFRAQKKEKAALNTTTKKGKKSFKKNNF
jgi:hypothetical protein